MCALKSGICSIKSGLCSIKSGKYRYLQGLHFTCIYLQISCKRLTFSVKLLLFCARTAFACWGWLWLFSFASKQCFCDRKPWLLRTEKNNAALWMGHPRCQGAWFLRDIQLCRLLTLLLLLWRLLWQHRHQLPQLSHRTWVAIALLALLLTSHCGQTFNRLSSAIASQAIFYTNKLN